MYLVWSQIMNPSIGVTCIHCSCVNKTIVLLQITMKQTFFVIVRSRTLLVQLVSLGFMKQKG